MEPSEREEIERKIQHLHRSTGHGSMESLVRALERRGTAQKVLQVARSWKCPTCAERKRQDPRRFATFETSAAKGEMIEIDIATWCHPVTKEKHSVIVMVDVGSRFSVGKVVPGSSWEELRGAMEELWFPYFGMPKTVRADPGGGWLNKNADAYFAERDVYFELIPGEAHWKIGIVEQSIKTLKGMMEKLTTDFPTMELKEAVSQSLWTMNNRDLFRGYSPMQYVMSRSPDLCGHMFESDRERPIHPQLLRDNGLQEEEQVRAAAEKAFVDEQAKRKVERAARMGNRAYKHFAPGDLVYYWRRQVPKEERSGFGGGKFLGPARVLATETRREGKELRPGGTVWLHRGGHLLRAAPEQLRHATRMEEMVEEFQGPIELPWTITSICQHGGRKCYEDISKESPSEAQWRRSLEEEDLRKEREKRKEPEWAPTRRHDSKKPLDMETAKKVKIEAPKGAKRSFTDEVADGERKLAKNEEAKEEVLQAFYAREEHRKGYELELHLPTSKRQWKRFARDPEAFMVTQLRKQQVEVRERNLSPEEAMKFAKAKNKEVRNFISSECFRLVEDQFPHEKEIIGMRWLLTWKYDPSHEDGVKAKARAIVLGYQDPSYEHRKTSAPTPSKAGRQLFFQLCAWKKFKIQKGDVSGAFLQGEELDEPLWCRPLPEICQEMGVAEDTPMLLTKAAYGLVQAPLQWYESICNTMSRLGYQRLKTEPCCWIFRDATGDVCSVIHGHVDDFVFGGRENCEIHGKLLQELQKSYQWGAWEETCFEQCGILVRQEEDFSISLSQQRFVEEVEEISLARDRARQPELPATDKEKSSLRGVLGSLSWLCGQTCFMFAVDTNFLISEIPVATVETINKTNALVRSVKRWKSQEYRIHHFDAPNLHLVTWADAAWANRPNGKDSTAGIFIGMSDERLIQGAERNISPIYWRSARIDRVCRSPACAETMACINAEDDMLYLRVLWYELCGGILDARVPNEAASQIPAMLVTDARNLYDKLQRPTVCIKGAEKRSDIEAISLREHLDATSTPLAWVHGGAMIANGLTKPGEKHQVLMYVTLGFRFRITYDEERQSEKVRRKKGLGALENTARTTYNTFCS